ncbi:hypothetical protein GCM10020295_53000 [Streptomyces cinereospinus]
MLTQPYRRVRTAVQTVARVTPLTRPAATYRDAPSGRRAARAVDRPARRHRRQQTVGTAARLAHERPGEGGGGDARRRARGAAAERRRGGGRGAGTAQDVRAGIAEEPVGGQVHGDQYGDGADDPHSASRGPAAPSRRAGP